MQEKKSWEAPKLVVYDTVAVLTGQLDKCGSQADIFTAVIPSLDGDIVEDGNCRV
jgi:hypothetical protein